MRRTTFLLAVMLIGLLMVLWGCFFGPIVGSWTIDDVVLYYFDDVGVTINNTMVQTNIFDGDGFFSATGTSQWEGSPVQTIEGDGTYTYNEEAGTLQMTYTTFLMDGAPMEPPPSVPLLSCVIEGGVMTLTWPDPPQIYSPAEPMVYVKQ